MNKILSIFCCTICALSAVGGPSVANGPFISGQGGAGGTATGNFVTNGITVTGAGTSAVNGSYTWNGNYYVDGVYSNVYVANTAWVIESGGTQYYNSTNGLLGPYSVAFNGTTPAPSVFATNIVGGTVGLIVGPSSSVYDAGSVTNVQGSSVVGPVANATTAANLTGTLPLSQLPAQVVTNVGPAYIGQQGVMLEQFGATANGRVNFDFTTTANASNVVSLASTFTSADIGKWLVVYYSLQCTNYLFGQITNVVNANTVNLNSNAQLTVTGQMGRWGTDNTIAINQTIAWCLTNNVHNIYATNGTYFVAGTPSLTGSNNLQPIYSILQVGTANYWHNYNTYTNGPFQLSIYGVGNAKETTTGYYAQQRKGVTGGTTLFCPVVGTYNGNDHLLSTSSSNANFGIINLEIKGVKFLHPAWSTISTIDNSFGGGIKISQCEFTSDWNGQGNQSPNQGQGWANTNCVQVRLANTSNNGDQIVEDSEFDGGWAAISGSDHADVYRSWIIRQAIGYISYRGLEQYFDDTRFDVCMTNMWLGVDNSGGSQIQGHLKFSRDDTAQYHGSIWNPSGASEDVNIVVYDDSPSFFDYFNGGIHYNYGPYFNVSLVGPDIYLGLPAQGLQSGSNYFGATLAANHFPYGVQTPGANSYYDWVNGAYFGYASTTANSLWYNSQYKQWDWNASQSGENLQFRSQTQGAIEAGLAFDSGNIWTLGTFYGNGGGLTNLNATNAFASTNIYVASSGATYGSVPSENPATTGPQQLQQSPISFGGAGGTTNAGNMTVQGNINATGTYSGNGSALTNLNSTNLVGIIQTNQINMSQIPTGTPNAALTNAPNVFTASNSFVSAGFSGTVTAGNLTTGALTNTSPGSFSGLFTGQYVGATTNDSGQPYGVAGLVTNGIQNSSMFAVGANYLAVGNAAIVNATNGGVSVGINSQATGTNSTAIGKSAIASGSYSTASGNSSTASGYDSTASGFSSTASGYGSTASGTSSTASGTSSTANGYDSTASGIYSTANGTLAKSASSNSIAIGSYSYVSLAATNGIAIGNNASATATNASTWGANSTNTTPNSIKLGYEGFPGYQVMTPGSFVASNGFVDATGAGFTGNGNGLTNFWYPTNFSIPIVPTGKSGIWVSNGWLYYLTAQHPNGVLISAP